VIAVKHHHPRESKYKLINRVLLTGAALPVSDLIAEAEAAAQERAAQCRPVTLALAEMAKAMNQRRLA